MARIELHPSLPNNIVELGLDDVQQWTDYYEKGFLIVVRGRRVDADFQFLATLRDPSPNHRRKYILTHPSHVARERDRSAAWGHFRDRVFQGDAGAYEHFGHQVLAVNQQLFDVADRAFPGYRYLTCPIAWKLQDLPQGENLHIDNLDGCEKFARMRVFTNLGTEPRVWKIGAHVRDYAHEWYEAADLGRHLHSPWHFNRELTLAAFGSSIEGRGDRYPRHHVEFDPGDIWLLNSAMTAHQVVRGTRLALTTFAFPYWQYRNPREALPRIVADIGRSRLGTLRYAARMGRHRLASLLHRKRS